MAVYRHSLDPFFLPNSVAVLGASGTPGSVGSILMRNLLGNPFGGVVYPVNPNRRAVHGVSCYPSLHEVPEVADLAIIATPAVTVPAMVHQCVERGVLAAIIISAGFSELGTEGRALEKEIKNMAHGKLRIIGPNCLGVLHPGQNLNASFASSMPRPGRVALLSQSGAICSSILDWAREKHIGFSSFVSVGTMLDVDFADLIDYFGDDPQTQSIVIYMESIGDVAKFLSATRAVARTKHVIMVKAGRYEAGARAAASHTGSITGSDAVFETAIRRAGGLRVFTIPDLFNMAEILALQPPPRGPGLGIITNAGGPGVLATDALMAGGGQLAPLSPQTRTALDALLPPYWSHANPIDILGDATPERYRQVVEICARDRAMQGLLILLAPQAMTNPTETARQLVSFAKLDHKPVLASWMGGTEVREGRNILSQAGIATFDSPDAAIRAFLHMAQYRRNQELLYERPAMLPEDWIPNQEKVRNLLAQVRAEGRTLLTEIEAKELLGAYGIPVVPTLAATNPEQAVQIARSLGYPVVLKLLSRTIAHKTDAGGVQLHLTDDASVRQAFAAIKVNADRYARAQGIDPAFLGVAVQPMIRTKGYELIVGSMVDVQFGPVILFGAGGILVEIFQDRVLGLPPLNRTLARRLLERAQIFKALQGVRGQPPVPLDQLETLLVRFSYLLCDFLEIQEIDINPVLAGPEAILALDACVILSDPNQGLEKRTQLAIEPYPNQYTTQWQMKDGTPVLLRAIRPEDEPLIVAFHGTHSEQTIRRRFFSMVKQLSRDNLIRLCHLDYAREMALVAEMKINGSLPRIIGVARYYMNPETRSAEFAVIVGDQWQGHGLGRHLMEQLIVIARQRNVRRLIGSVLSDNFPMLHLAKELGFRENQEGMDEITRVVLDL